LLLAFGGGDSTTISPSEALPELGIESGCATCEPLPPPDPLALVPFLLTSVAGWPKLVVLSVARCRGEKTWVLAAARDSNDTLQASQWPVKLSLGTGWPATGDGAGSMTVS